MNVLAAMAGINNGEFCKKFTKQGVDIITLGGYNIELDTFKAGLEIMTSDDNNRKEFFTCPHHLSEDITEEATIIREFNPSWNGKISVNLRGIDPNSFKVVYSNDNVDIIEVNAHCRQEPMLKANAGQKLLEDTEQLSKILEEVTNNSGKEISVKIRTNVENVDTLKIIELLNSYNIDYIHVDATKPGVMEADYDMINKISQNTNIHIIGNNCVTAHEDYLKMLDSGANSVSVARAALNGDIGHIFGN